MLIICPGIHAPELTQDFLQGVFGAHQPRSQIFPTQSQPVYSAIHVFSFLQESLAEQFPASPLSVPLVFVSFSAGVVGAIGAAWAWQQAGGKVKGFIALDGWGVALGGQFPVHRLSHDGFTHWSSALLGAGQDSFYADPAIAHLDLWRSPQMAQGWGVCSSVVPGLPATRTATTAAQFLRHLFHQYGELGGNP